MGTLRVILCLLVVLSLSAQAAPQSAAGPTDELQAESYLMILTGQRSELRKMRQEEKENELVYECLGEIGSELDELCDKAKAAVNDLSQNGAHTADGLGGTSSSSPQFATLERLLDQAERLREEAEACTGNEFPAQNPASFSAPQW